MFTRPFQKLFLTCALLGASVHAAYPDKPVRLVVPWAAGGSTDAVARAVAQRMTETMGQSVIVDNRAGASGRSARMPSPSQRPMATRSASWNCPMPLHRPPTSDCPTTCCAISRRSRCWVPRR